MSCSAFGLEAQAGEEQVEPRPELVGISIATVGLGCSLLTGGVEHGWLSPLTIASAVGAVLALVTVVRHERRTSSPMLDLRVFSVGTVRGAVIAQLGTSIAMAAVMFGLILHVQYASAGAPSGLASPTSPSS